MAVVETPPYPRRWMAWYLTALFSILGGLSVMGFWLDSGGNFHPGRYARACTAAVVVLWLSYEFALFANTFRIESGTMKFRDFGRSRAVSLADVIAVDFVDAFNAFRWSGCPRVSLSDGRSYKLRGVTSGIGLESYRAEEWWEWLEAHTGARAPAASDTLVQRQRWEPPHRRTRLFVAWIAATAGSGAFIAHFDWGIQAAFAWSGVVLVVHGRAIRRHLDGEWIRSHMTQEALDFEARLNHSTDWPPKDGALH